MLFLCERKKSRNVQRRPFNRGSKTQPSTAALRNLEPLLRHVSIIIGIDPSLSLFLSLARSLAPRYLASTPSFSAPRTPPPFIIHDGRHQNSVISRYIAVPTERECNVLTEECLAYSFQRSEYTIFRHQAGTINIYYRPINSPTLYLECECVKHTGKLARTLRNISRRRGVSWNPES